VTIEWSLPWNGGCRCAKLRIRATAAPILTMTCHCKGCQRMSASAYSLSAMFPSNGFMVSEGEPVIGGIHGEHCHYFLRTLQKLVVHKAARRRSIHQRAADNVR